MQSDIVQRLEDEYGLNGGQGAYAWKARELCGKAAAEITRLTEALRAAEEREKGLRDGWVLVPEEPTWEMLEAARDGVILNPKMDAMMKRGLRANWKAMIRAALKGPSHESS